MALLWCHNEQRLGSPDSSMAKPGTRHCSEAPRESHHKAHLPSASRASRALTANGVLSVGSCALGEGTRERGI